MSDLIKNEQTPMEIAKEVITLEKEAKELKVKLDLYRASLLKATQDLDVLTLKTGDYTISRAKRKTLKVLDKREFEKELKDKDVEIVYKTEIDMGVMKPIVKDHIDEFNSLEEQVTEYISIRINK